MTRQFVLNILIGDLCREKIVDDARKLFDEMLKKGCRTTFIFCGN